MSACGCTSWSVVGSNVSRSTLGRMRRAMSSRELASAELRLQRSTSSACRSVRMEHTLRILGVPFGTLGRVPARNDPQRSGACTSAPVSAFTHPGPGCRTSWGSAPVHALRSSVVGAGTLM
eukprot:scaffold47890_cov60-Phaeocystis_antarctica.AAC.1